jgi:hypothetical protein
MGHPGEKRLWETLSQRDYHPNLRYHIDKSKCKDRQKHKLAGLGYDILPKWEVRIAPWEEVAKDLIGPWKVKVNVQQVIFNALTCIDMALNLVELIHVDNRAAKHIHDKFMQSWLCQYPRPVWCLHDKGGEIIGQNFQWLLEIISIKDVSSTSKNPQSNAICERMHQTLPNVLRTLVHTNPPQNMTQARDIIYDALATAMHAMQNHHCYYLREYSRCSCCCLRYVFEHAANCKLAGHCTYLWTLCQWEFTTCQQEVTSVWLRSRTTSSEESARSN